MGTRIPPRSWHNRGLHNGVTDPPPTRASGVGATNVQGKAFSFLAMFSGASRQWGQYLGISQMEEGAPDGMKV